MSKSSGYWRGFCRYSAVVFFISSWLVSVGKGYAVEAPVGMAYINDTDTIPRIVSFGNTYTASGAQMTVHAPFTFNQGTGGAFPGIIQTARAEVPGVLCFASGVQPRGMSDAAYVDGYVCSYRDTGTFIFPVGAGGSLRPCIAYPSGASTSGITAAYYGQQPPAWLGVDTSLLTVSEGFWHIRGADATGIGLVLSPAQQEEADLSLLGWRGDHWEVIPAHVVLSDAVGIIGTTDTSWLALKSDTTLVPDTYQVFALGRIEPEACQATFTVDLTGQPWGTYQSPATMRTDNCCGATSGDCISIEVTLDAQSIGLVFEIAEGAIPPGALYYTVDCGTAIPVGSDVLLQGGNTYTITFCKPGLNTNSYRITAIGEEKSGPLLVALYKGRNETDRLWAIDLVPETALPDGVAYGVSYGTISTLPIWADSMLSTAVTQVYNNPASWQDSTCRYFTGYPEFVDACQWYAACACPTTLQASDVLQYAACPDSVGGLWGSIYRTFTATDCRGNTSTVVQEIRFHRPIPIHTEIEDYTIAGDDASEAGIVLGDSQAMPFVMVFNSAVSRQCTPEILIQALKRGQYPNIDLNNRVQPKYIFADLLSNDTTDRYAYFEEALGTANYNYEGQAFGNLGQAASVAGTVINTLGSSYSFEVEQLSAQRNSRNKLEVLVLVSAIDSCTAAQIPLDYLLLTEGDWGVPCPEFSAVLSSAPGPVCVAGEVAFRVEFSGGEAPYQLRYRIGDMDSTIVQYPDGAWIYFPAAAADSVTLLTAVDANGCEALIPTPGLPFEVYSLEAPLTISAGTVCMGATVTITATAPVYPGNLTYQWYRSLDSVTWVPISGATGTRYIAPTTEPGITYYRIRTTAVGCMQYSQAIAVEVIEPVQVEILAPGVSACASDTITLGALVRGWNERLSYQWKSSINNSTFSNISRATTDTLSYFRGSAGTTYFRVEVQTGLPGCPLYTSNTIAVSFVAPPVVNLSVTSDEVCAGTSVTLTAGAVGTGSFTYEWQQSRDSLVWNTLPAWSASTYTPQNTNTGKTYYRVLAQGTQSACTGTSIVKSILVVPAPSILVDASADEACVGGVVQLRSALVFEGKQQGVAYSWQEGAAGSSTWTAISNATGAGFGATYARTGERQYRVLARVSTPGCAQAVSNPLAVAYVSRPGVALAIADSVVCVDGTTSLLAAVAQPVGTMSYQWQSSSNQSNWKNLPDNTEVLSVVGLRYGTTYYRVQVRSDAPGCGTGVTSNVRSLRVSAPPTVQLSAAATAVCTGTPVNLSASTDNPLLRPASWEWERSFNRLDWQALGSTSEAAYTDRPELPGSIYYRAIMRPSTPGCGEVVSPSLAVVLTEPLTIALSSVHPAICTKGTTTLEAKLSAPLNSVLVWQQSSNGTSWSTILGASKPTYVYTGSSTGTRYFRVQAKVPVNSGCNTPISPAVAVRTNASINVSAQVSPTSLCVGAQATIRLNVTGGAGNLSYQWLRGRNTATLAALAGETSSELYISEVEAQTLLYQVQVSDDAPGCGTNIRLPQAVSIKPAFNPVVQVRAETAQLCTSGSTALSAIVSGGTGNPIYFWQQSRDALNWQDVPTSVTGGQYRFVPVDTGRVYFRAIVWFDGGTCRDAVSAALPIDVTRAPEVAIAAIPDSVCIGARVELNAQVAYAQPTTYIWEYRNKGTVSWINTGASSAPIYAINANTPITREYRVRITTNTLGCTQAASTPATITAVSRPVTQITATATLVCPNTAVTLSSVTSGGAGSKTYQWQQASVGSSTFVNIPDATAASYRPNTGVSGYKNYRLLSSSAGLGCGSATPSANTIAVYVRTNCGNLNELLPTGSRAVVSTLYPRIVPVSLGTGSIRVPNAEPDAVVQVQGKQEVLLFQNIPNPFEGETRIRFYLPQRAEAQILVQDLSGRILWKQEAIYESGMHQVQISHKDLGTPGVYIYTLQTAQHVQSRKMVLIE